MDHLKQTLAKKLAEYYKEGSLPRACSCIDLECSHLGCSYWWELFLEYSSNDVSAMVQIYELARKRVK